ncbi:hypothetical protein [Mucilaginibacter psychrotolerans]|uniref:Uncharacterized protein n=1 Tax=Mucilaginibacter psychrotolerans TaxID=1524096 RepID=A0A4Y8SGV5_9SPHI|nr:hypothetical protein [Mucilaginibacter psychrotolerans]TFF37656.1 hypothetical protein E2R66_10830 [Mucilaginibacter psychrotolerans]
MDENEKAKPYFETQRELLQKIRDNEGHNTYGTEWGFLQHLLRVLVGQFAPKYHGQFAPKQWVSLRRNGVVSFVIATT